MAVRFGSGISGLAALRSLNKATDEATRARERLATGMRINRGSDDPASLAVSENLLVQSKILRQGTRNISDGISIASVADGALSSVSSILARMIELSEQAANGIYGSTQRRSLDKEYQALSQEIERIAKTTTFNGITLLGGKARTPTFRQVTSMSGGVGITQNDLGLVLTADGRTAIVHNATTNQLQYVDTATGATTTIANVSLATGYFSATPRIAADATGENVAFISSDNLTGQNASGQLQIFLFNRTSGAITQVTQTQGAEAFLGFTMSADGSTIAFTSLTDQTSGTPTYTASGGVFTYNIASGAFTNVGGAHAVTNVGTLKLSADGSYLSFESSANINGQNADGNFEHWIVNTNNPLGTLRQFTTSTGAEANFVTSVVTNDGDVYFASTRNFVGSNAQGAAQLFHYSLAQQTLRQITNTASGTDLFYLQGSNDGRKLYISSLVAPNGAPLSTAGVFSYDTASGVFEQIGTSPSTPVGVNYAVAADGSRLIFVSMENHGSNADGNWELFTLDLTNEANPLSIETGQGQGSSSAIAMSLEALTTAVHGLGGYLISTASAARGTLRGLRENLNALNEIRGKLGASMSRLDTAVRVGASQALELDAATSRIRDVDVAQSASELLAAEIRQQLATFVLAQANQSPALVLRLLNAE